LPNGTDGYQLIDASDLEQSNSLVPVVSRLEKYEAAGLVGILLPHGQTEKEKRPSVRRDTKVAPD
jgi:hypothetical protein